MPFVQSNHHLCDTDYQVPYDARASADAKARKSSISIRGIFLRLNSLIDLESADSGHRSRSNTTLGTREKSSKGTRRSAFHAEQIIVYFFIHRPLIRFSVYLVRIASGLRLCAQVR